MSVEGLRGHRYTIKKFREDGLVDVYGGKSGHGMLRTFDPKRLTRVKK